jgi:UDP-3-O-[3-hydroxymyristoyl] N-acetylglucosamine deacetylase
MEHALHAARQSFMSFRRTLRTSVSCTGTGLHCGRPARLTLHPAPAGYGIRFVRSDLGLEVPARLEYLDGVEHATTLRRGDATVGTVEHLLSALYAVGVDDVRIVVDGPEVPILDGSSAPFVVLIHEAGLRAHAEPRAALAVLRPIEVQVGDKWARLLPAAGFEISYAIAFDHPLLRHQAIELDVSVESFVEQIAPARTFGFLSEVEALQRQGLARGGSLDNAIVIGDTAVLNGTLRFEDEFVRHKVLDAIGDLALLGRPLMARLEAYKAGHAVHVALARAVVARPECWTLVTRRPAPRAAVGLSAEG